MLTTTPPGAADVEPLSAWLRREWVLVAITTGVAIDWLPWVLTPILPGLGVLSGTRLLVLPALVLDALRGPAWVRRPHRLGVYYLLAIGIGGGLGWLSGTVSTGRWTTIILNGIILLYYLHIKSLVSIRRVLAIVFGASLIVPLVQLLTKLQVITDSMLESLGIVLDPNSTRIFSIFDSTTVGFVPLIIPACLGGFLLVPRERRTFALTVLAAAVMIFGATSAVVAEQRSGVLAYIISAAVAIVCYLGAERSYSRRLLIIGLAGFGALGAGFFLGGLSSEARQRFGDAQALEAAKELRLGGVTTFISDLTSDPLNLVPIGHQSLLDRTGVEPHLIFSEAFYEGGPIFLLMVTVILFKFAAAVFRLVRSPDPRVRLIGNVVCAFGAGAALDVMIQTAIGLRLVPLMLGVGFAADRIRRNSAETA